MTVNSRRKGKTGELELAAYLRSFGFDARRSQQFKGNVDSADLECPDLEALGFHIECKRREKLTIWPWIEQGMADVGESGKVPLIFWRPNNKPWLAILRAEDFLDLINSLEDKSDG